MLLAAVIIITAMRAGAQVSCADAGSTAPRSTNRMVVLFTPPLRNDVTVRLFDERGNLVRVFPLFNGGTERKVLDETLDRPFYPEKSYVATTAWTECMQGKATRDTPFAPCTGSFSIAMESLTSRRLATKPPISVVVDAAHIAAVDVTVRLPMNTGGGHCVRKHALAGRAIGEEPIEVGDGEDFRLTVYRTERTSSQPACSVNIARVRRSGMDQARPDTDDARQNNSHGGQAHAGSSPNYDLIAGQCQVVKVRLRK
jgi:hypothetical protein